MFFIIFYLFTLQPFCLKYISNNMTNSTQIETSSVGLKVFSTEQESDMKP